MVHQKRTLGQRTAAVLSIIGGAGYALIGLIAVAFTSTLNNSVSADLGMAVLWSYGILAFGVVTIILGSMFCRTLRQPLVAISLIVIQLVLIVFSIVDQNAQMGWLGWIFSGLIIIFCIFHLMKGAEVYGTDSTKATHTQTTLMVVEPQPAHTES